MRVDERGVCLVIKPLGVTAILFLQLLQVLWGYANLELLVDVLLETVGNTCLLLCPPCTEGPEEEDLLVSFLVCIPAIERENKDNSDSELTFRGVTSAKSTLTYS